MVQVLHKGTRESICNKRIKIPQLKPSINNVSNDTHYERKYEKTPLCEHFYDKLKS